MFNKKFYLAGLAVLLSVSLFVIGCEGPVGADGNDGQSIKGDQGVTPDVPVPVNQTTVTAGELSSIFARDGVKTVMLMNSVTSVSGVVPAGQTLVVAERTTGIAVAASSSLDVKGVLEIPAGVVLDASYVSGASGYLKVTKAGGSASTYSTALQAASDEPKVGISGGGRIKLPFVVEGKGSLPAGVLSYADLASVSIGGAAIEPVIGSVRNLSSEGDGPGHVLGVSDIADLTTGDGAPALPDGVLEINSPLTSITAAHVPAGVTLKLTATGNTAASLDLSTAGTLIVAAGADLSATTSIAGRTDEYNIIVEGALKLGGTPLTVGKGVDLSKAEIDATGVSAASVLNLLGTEVEVRSIKASATASQDLSITGPKTLKVTKGISSGSTSGVKSDTITKYAVGLDENFVALKTQDVNFIISAAADNVFTVETASSTVTIGSPLTFGDATKVKLNGTGGIQVTGIATAGDPETPANLELTTANLAHFIAVDNNTPSKITVSDAATGVAETLVIPKGVEVTAATATLTAIEGLTVDGTLTAAQTMLGVVKTLTVNGTLTADTASLGSATNITIGDGGTFTTASTTLVLPSDASVTVGNDATLTSSAASTWANLKTLKIGDRSNVDLSGGATLANIGSITVGTGSELKVGTALALPTSLAASTAITGPGKITATGAVTGTGTAKKLIESDVATVTLKETGYSTSDTLTVPLNKTRILDAALTMTGGSIAVNGKLIVQDDLTLAGAATIGSNGDLILATGKKITLGHASAAKIVGASYEIAYPASNTETTATVTATEVSGTAVVFQANAIVGIKDSADDDNGKALSSPTLRVPATTAAVLAFGTKDSVLTLKGATTVDGVILDVATHGKITVPNTQVLTLKYSGAADNGAASGGIFTKAGALATKNAVKANALEDTTALSPDTAVGLAGATIATDAGTTTAVKAETPADGTITGGTDGITVEKEKVFVVTGAVITLST